MKIMFKVIGLLAMVIGIALSPVKAQTDMKNDQPTTEMRDNKKVELQAKTAKKKDGKDIKPLASNLNSSKSNAYRKGCYIDLDNKTDYSIDLYINDKYIGTMPKSGKYTTPGFQTSVEVYFKTEPRKDGTYLYWGPHTHNCGSKTDGGNVYYFLNPAATFITF